MAYLWRRSNPVKDSRGRPVLDDNRKAKRELTGNYLIVDKYIVNGEWRNKMFPTGTENLATAQRELGKHEQRSGNRIGTAKDTPFSIFLKEMRNIQIKATLSYERKELFTYRVFEKEFGSTFLGQITATNIQDYQSRLLKTMSQGSVRKYMGSLRHIFNIAIKRDAFPGPNPFVKVDICKPGKPREISLSPDERSKLLAACLIPQGHRAAIEPQTLHDLVKVAVDLGLRKGEIIGCVRKAGGIVHKVGGLRIRDFDRKTNTLKFWRTKTDSMTEIDLSGFPDMAKLFQRRTEGKTDANEFMFTRKGKPIFDVCKSYRLAVKNAGISKINKRTGEPMSFTFHSLRHSAASFQLRAGIPLEIVARILGDNIQTVHKIYANELQQGHIKEGMKAYAKYLRGMDNLIESI